MEITISLHKKLEQSAGEYFEKAKKLRKKAEGARETVKRLQKELEQIEKKQAEAVVQKKEKKTRIERQKEWYEKFRWFISSEGFFCIGGRDAQSNEIVVKKHTEKDDIVFHTETPGSPFFVIKTKGKKPGEATLQETADATASFSRAWKLGIGAIDVYSVAPEQLSRQAPSGEYIQKGAFIVTGKRTHYTGKPGLAVGKLEDGRIMSGPESAVKKNCSKYLILQQGRDKPSDCAKKIAKELDAEIDDALRLLPGGECKLVSGK